MAELGSQFHLSCCQSRWGWGEILMRLPVKYLELVRMFKEVIRNFKSTFRYIEDAKNLKTIGAYTESTDLIVKAI